MNKLVTTHEAVAILNQGGVGIMPTDTVYGLVARAADEKAAGRVYQLKHRERKPCPIIAANIQQLVDLGVKARYLHAVEQYWPNPVSIIIPAGQNLAYLHQGLGSLPFRIPADDALRSILEQTGPLIASSANLPGEPPATTSAMAYDYFKDTADFYLEGGDISGRQPSTIIRIVDDAIEVLREGALAISSSGRIGGSGADE